MDDSNNRSRLRKLEKRRKNTKLMSILIIVAGVLLLLLVVFWIFGGKDNGSNEKKPDTDSSQVEDDGEDSPETDRPDDETDEKPQLGMDEDDESEDVSEEEHHVVETTEADPSDDNVIEAYTGDWQIVETVQEGTHTTNYDDGSQDRIEIKEGVMRATGLSEDLVEWRVGNGGDQKVIATVSDPDETRIYRVYLSWIENQGWQPTKVEVLKENDKK